MIDRHAALIALAAIAVSVPAQADVTISSAATQNMNCTGGTCVPTATDAVLNIDDVQNFLSVGNLTIVTTNGSIQANDIDVAAPFSWTAANTLTLDAFHSITVTDVVRDEGAGGVSLVTNDGGSNGTLAFLGVGKMLFSNVEDALIINGTTYKLAATLKELVYDIVAHPTHAFALAKSYDAQKDGAYTTSPISIPFSGSFSGLGNAISNLEIENTSDSYLGFFADVTASGSISGLKMRHVVVRGGQVAGGLVGLNEGTVTNSSTSGLIDAAQAGGLVGYNYGTVFRTSSSATVKGSYSAGDPVAEHTAGLIVESFATGKAAYNKQQIGRMDAGGLVGFVFAPVRDSYAEGIVHDTSADNEAGGLAAFINESGGATISTSYSTGMQRPHPSKGRSIGGFIGYIYMDATTISNCYWDTTTSMTDVGVGADGDTTGVTGLTTAQLQSGLPTGFDPAIWAENPDINDGLPYLINNPPPK